MSASRTKEDWFKEGNALFDLKHYQQALQAYEQAICLDPNYLPVYTKQGLALSYLKRFEEALLVWDPAWG